MLEEDDWRLTNHKSYLLGKKLSLEKFIPRLKDHEHCVFCWKKIMADSNKDIHREANTTQDEQYWVCKNCFVDFKEIYKWGQFEAYNLKIPSDFFYFFNHYRAKTYLKFP